MHIVKQGTEIEIHSCSFYPEFQKYTEEQNALIVESIFLVFYVCLHYFIVTNP